MRLVVTFLNCSRPPDVRTRMELTFRNAMLEYEPDVSRIKHFQQKNRFEYGQTYLRGRWASFAFMTIKEREQVKVLVGFEL